jgi:hypothetical protein
MIAMSRGLMFPFAALVLAACQRGLPAPAASLPAPALPAASASASSASAAPAAPPLLTPADVDARVRAEWQKAGVEPTAPANDAAWLRRVWIDVAGTIPPAEVATRFLADRAADRRARMVDELLGSPLWADHWTAYWDDQWMGREARGPDVDRGAFRAFLRAEFARNAPWSEVATLLLTATGKNSNGGSRRQSDENDGAQAAPADVNGAVNWTLKYQTNPQDMAGTASRTLLGVQIQCAQCHDHKTEKWTQGDFQGFAAAFVRTRLVPLDAGNPMGAVKRVEVHDLDRPAPRFGKMGDLEAIGRARPRALDGTDLGATRNVRVALAQWITAPQNPWFARAFVNRMWGHFLGRGFVDPVDDLRPSNPPVAPELFDALAADFVRSGYDMKHLARVIVLSEVYARSAAPLPEATAKVDPEARLWERFRVAPLGPDELFNALVTATRLDAIVRSTGRLDLAAVRFRVRQRYGFLFDVDEDASADDYEGTIAQALALLNGSVTVTGASVLPGSALSDVLAMPGDEAGDPARVEALYLRVLSRLPTAAETARWTKFVADAQAAGVPPAEVASAASGAPSAAAPNAARPGKSGKPNAKGRPPPPDPLRGLGDRAGTFLANERVRAWEDVLWALLNSSEFVLNH